MKTKLFNYAITILLVASCSKTESVELIGNDTSVEHISVLDLMLSASIDQNLVRIMHEEAEASLNAGLEESIYFDEIINDDPVETKSASDRDCLRNYLLSAYMPHNSFTKSGTETDITNLNDIEIYWPYSEDWDGISQPVIVLRTGNDDQYIEDDKTYAYRMVAKEGAIEMETLIVNEEYAKKNPVWVIGKSDLPFDEIVNLKHGNYDQTSIIPRTIPETRALPNDYVSRLMVTTLQSTQQHDDWVNGGSEYVLYWFFPTVFDKTGAVETNICGQIKMSRKEINNKVVRTINFLGNDDWIEDQLYNRLKIIEFDPGKDMKFDIDLKGTYKGFTGELKTSITLNKTDEMILDQKLERKAQMADELLVDPQEKSYSRTLFGGGVYVTTLFRPVTVQNAF